MFPIPRLFHGRTRLDRITPRGPSRFRPFLSAGVLCSLVACLAALTVSEVSAQDGAYRWDYYVGSKGGIGSDDGPSSAARLNLPKATAVDAAGNVYVADTNSQTVRKITAAGVVTTLAGTVGDLGQSDGTGSAALFEFPSGIAVDGNGNVFVADTYNHSIRKITPAGVVTTFAGHSGTSGTAGGVGDAARFKSPQGIAIDAGGNLYVADTDNNKIRKITSAGLVSTFAGSGVDGSTDGSASNASFNSPTGVAVDASGNLYIADYGNQIIRKITPTGTVSTLAGKAGLSGATNGTGSAARFADPFGVAVDGSGNVYVSDCFNNMIRKVTSSGEVTTVAGRQFAYDSLDGTGTAASFHNPKGISIDANGNLYVADWLSHVIRKIDPGAVVTTLAGKATITGAADGTGSAAQFYLPFSLVMDGGGSLYIAEYGNQMIRKITSGGVTSVLAGSPTGYGYHDDTGSAAMFENPHGVAVDGSGNTFVADTENHVIRKITSTGVVTTLAGKGQTSGSADGTGNAARFKGPYGVAVDGSGNVFVADTSNHAIRKVTSNGVVTTFAGSAGLTGSVNGTGSAARFNNPGGITIDASGNLYVADYFNHAIRKITPAAEVTTLTSAVSGLYGLAVDAEGNVYSTDYGDHVIRKTTSSGVTTVIGGSADLPGNRPGIGPLSRFYNPTGVVVGPQGTLYVAGYSNANLMIGTPIADIKLQHPAGTNLVSDTSTVNWGTVNFGAAASGTRTFTVVNQGAAALTDLDVTIDGSPTGNAVDDFTLTTPLNVSSIPGGGSATFVVTFTPSALGTRTATLHVASNDPDLATITIALTGNGADLTAPTISAVHLVSSNPHSAWARVGDTVTLSFTASEAIQPPVATLLGSSVTATNTDGNNWIAAVTVGANSAQGPVGFSIAFSDLVGNAGPTTSATSDGSAVKVDRTAPTLTLPANITREAGGPTGNIVSYTATAGDALDPGFVFNIAPVSGSRFAITTTTVNATVTDAAGNTTTGSFTVTIRDSIAPTLTVPSNLTAEASGPDGATVNYPAASANDAVGIDSLTYSKASGTIFPLGATTVTVTAKDGAGNSKSGSFTVTVQDKTPPTASVQGEFLYTARVDGTAILGDLRYLVDHSDTVSATTVAQLQPPGSILHLGRNTVQFRIDDEHGNFTYLETYTRVVFAPTTDVVLAPGAKAGPLVRGTATGDGVPDAGTDAIPDDATFSTFGAPALNPSRTLLTRATMLSARKTISGIYWETGAHEGRMLAIQNGPALADGGEPMEGVTFKSFLDPVFSSDGYMAFAAKLQGPGAKSGDDGVWWDFFSDVPGTPTLVLRENSPLPLLNGERLKSVNSMAMTWDGLLANVTLLPERGLVTTRDDNALIRMNAADSTILMLREGRPLSEFDFSEDIVKSFTVLAPALGSPGQGRWLNADGVLVKVTLMTGEVRLMSISFNDVVEQLLSTYDPATVIAPEAQWKSFSIPACSETGLTVVSATLKPAPGIATTKDDTVLIAGRNAHAWQLVARENAPISADAGSPRYATFFDPICNSDGRVAFLATLQGTGIKGTNKTALFHGLPGSPMMVARLGTQVPDELGQVVNKAATWSKFISYALPDKIGPVFLAETAGGDSNSKNKLALWGATSTGQLRRLLRTGTTLTPGGPLITAITVLNSSDGNFGATRSFNTGGSIALAVTLSDKSQKLLRIDLP